MIGRLLEDAIFLGRLGFFYHKAPEAMSRPGFFQATAPMTRKERFKWAWMRSTGQM